MYWELLRLENLHMQSDRFELMSKPISFAIFSRSLTCVISRDFNIRYFLRRCLNGMSLPHIGNIYFDGKKCSIGTISEAHELGIYEANLAYMFQNLNVALNVSMPDIPTCGWGLMAQGQLYEDVQRLLLEFEIEGIDPHELCGRLNDFQKQVVMLIRSYNKGAKLILFNFSANYSYTHDELKKLAAIFSKLREKNISVLCFSGAWMPDVFNIFDRYIVIEDNVIVRNEPVNKFTFKHIEGGISFKNGYVPNLLNNSEDVVISCRELPYGKPGEKKVLNFDLKKSECVGILDAKQELLIFKDIIAGKRTRGLESCFTHNGKPLKKDKKFLSKVAVLDYGFEAGKCFEKLSLYDNITVSLGGAMYKYGFLFSRRIQKYIVNELLVSIERPDLIELYGDIKKGLDNLDPEDQFVIEICRWLCIKPQVFILHNSRRNYSLLSSEKVGNLISKIIYKFQIPVLIIAPANEELSYFCSEIIRL